MNEAYLPTKEELAELRKITRYRDMKQTIKNFDIRYKRNYLKNVISTIGLSNGRRYLTLDDIDLMSNRDIKYVFYRTYHNLGHMNFDRLRKEAEWEEKGF